MTNGPDWATIGTFIATAIYAVFAACQWLTLRQQARALKTSIKKSDEANAAANRAATAAFSNAEAATKAVNTAAESLLTAQLAERAYVALIDAPDDRHMVARLPNGGIRLNIEVSIFNWGRTPSQVGPASLWKFIADALPANRPDDSADLIAESYGFVVPNGKIQVKQTIDLSPREWDSIGPKASPRQTLWLLGYIDYVDQFGHRHRGRYARRVTVGAENTIAWQFEKTKGYNCDEPQS